MTAETQIAPLAPAESAPRVETPFRRFLSDFFESKMAVTALLVLSAIIFVALFAPWISPQNPHDLGEIDIMDSRVPPGGQSMTGMTFWLSRNSVAY